MSENFSVSSLLVVGLSLSLAMTFLFNGVCNLTPILNANVHDKALATFQMAAGWFVQYGVTEAVRDASYLRIFCGILEISCAVALFFPRLADFAAVLLMIPRFVVIAFVVTAFGAQSTEMVGPVMLTVALLVLLLARARFRRRLGGVSGGGIGKMKKAE